MRSLLFVAILGIGAAACGDDNAANHTGSCTFGAPQPSCFEYTNATDDELALDASVMCSDNHGTFANSACARDGVIGGCRAELTGSHGPFTQTVWFYPGGNVASTADVMTKCQTLGTFVAP